MDRPYLESLRIQGYGCIGDATFWLSPLHALIGPNDSGKSTVLRAVETVAGMVTGSVSSELQGALARSAKTRQFTLEAAGSRWAVAHSNDDLYTDTFIGGARTDTAYVRLGQTAQRATSSDPHEDEFFSTLRGGARTFRLEARTLRRPTKLIPEKQPIVLDRHGHGLAAVYDAILSRDQEAFSNIRKRVTSLFPTIKNLQLYNPDSGGKALRIELTNNTLVDAEYMSEGLLYFLAFAALPYLHPTSILLVEEPENGLHPARIQQVMGLLRDLSKTTQVILSTHSPLVVNELQGHEVSVLTRESAVEGTQVRLLKDTPRFEERSQIYSLGELWVSYANGSDEGPLLSGGARP